jgi:hypothetical protein
MHILIIKEKKIKKKKKTHLPRVDSMYRELRKKENLFQKERPGHKKK